jgi:hypothetical protein
MHLRIASSSHSRFKTLPRKTKSISPTVAVIVHWILQLVRNGLFPRQCVCFKTDSDCFLRSRSIRQLLKQLTA